jgi:16S rRNA (adenine1518-N6/adenine1519-N6)-dimethyltransferase
MVKFMALNSEDLTPLSPSETRTLLEQLGHRPRHSLGQNFLIDGNIVRKSLDLAQIKANDNVIEVGPGLGTLTRALLSRGAHVWAVEKDPVLHHHLQEKLIPEFPQTLHLLLGDALDYPLANYTGNEFKIVANLPYAISTPWLDGVLERGLPSRMVLMLQQEAAQRYCAQPGTKSFGAISIFVQSAYSSAPGHKVAAACFYPKPDIESFLLHLVRKDNPVLFNAEAKSLIRGIFQQRRKQIGSLLKDRLADQGKAWIKQLVTSGLSPQSRPEDIPIELWCKLA